MEKKVKSIAELIAMKQQIAKQREEIKELYVPSIDSIIKYKPANRLEIVKARQLEDADADPYLVYSHVVEPALNDAQLQDAYNKGGKPYDIVDKIFAPREVGQIALAIIGNENGNIVKEIKN